MRAIIVSVDFGDLLEVTLAYNRHHFEDVLVVTTPDDHHTIEVTNSLEAKVYTTNSFYDDGAVFNKWKALEEGLEHYGREGWLCIMDADVLWPKEITNYQRQVGNLYTPKRRMMIDLSKPFPSEDMWRTFPLHRQQTEFAGYSQMFHAKDPHLGKPPWHEINWRHAGGADSFFQMKWPNHHKVRPPFEVLHLGAAGTNWCGRAVPYLDGSVHKDSTSRQEQLIRFVLGRKHKQGPERFSHEKTV